MYSEGLLYWDAHMTRSQNLKTLIIIPAYNEAKNIIRVVKAVNNAGYDYVIINDGSTDNTIDICLENDFNLLNLRENLGIGGAIQAGHKYALENDYDIDIQFDGDGQHDVSCIATLVQGISSGFDLVVGSRFVGMNNQFKSTTMRRVGIRWLSLMIRVFGWGRITDPTSGFRACGRRAIALFGRDYPIDYPEPESIISAQKHGLRVTEVPVVMHERQEGKSSIGAVSSIYYMIKVTLAIIILGLSSGEEKGE